MTDMTLKAIARELAADLGNELGVKVTQKQAEAVTNAVFASIIENMVGGHNVTVPGFGKFKVLDKPERQVRNPSTGEMSTAPAKRAPKFTPAKALKDAIAVK